MKRLILKKLFIYQYCNTLINVESIAEEKHEVRVCGEPSDLGISGLNLDNERYIHQLFKRWRSS